MTSPPTAAAVGNKFVLSYYTHLNQSPQTLQHFYKENSVFTHGSESTFGTDDETAFGVEEINKSITKLDFRDAKVTLSVVDCQPSSHGGFIVLVVGRLSNKGDAPRKFVQSFFLAEQQKGIFYVLNDTFRYLDDVKSVESSTSTPEPSRVAEESHRPSVTSEQSQTDPVKESGVHSSHPSVTASELSPAVPTKESVIPAELTTAKSNPPPVKSTQQPSSATQPPKKETSKPSGPPKKITPPSEEKIVPSGPKSWSNVASGATGTSAQSESPVPPPIHQSEKPIVSPPAQNPPQKTAPQKEEKSTGITSLFISNVPFNATQEQVQNLFARFGEVHSVVINSNKGYAFLEFKTLDAAQKAIHGTKNGELVLEGRTILAEERKPKKEGGGIKERRDDRGPRRGGGEERRGPRDDKRSPSNGKPARGPADKRS